MAVSVYLSRQSAMHQISGELPKLMVRTSVALGCMRSQRVLVGRL